MACREMDESQNEHIFGKLTETRKIIKNWRIVYNTELPHPSLGGLALTVFAKLNRSIKPASLKIGYGSA